MLYHVSPQCSEGMEFNTFKEDYFFAHFHKLERMVEELLEFKYFSCLHWPGIKVEKISTQAVLIFDLADYLSIIICRVQ